LEGLDRVALKLINTEYISAFLHGVSGGVFRYIAPRLEKANISESLSLEFKGLWTGSWILKEL